MIMKKHVWWMILGLILLAVILAACSQTTQQQLESLSQKCSSLGSSDRNACCQDAEEIEGLITIKCIGYWKYENACVFRCGSSQGCTEEAKMCPDGSTVGRTGPNCEFAPCPDKYFGNSPEA